MSRIGILTGGGDCPGLNGVICGIVERASQLGHEVIGFRRGWKGLLGNSQPIKLESDDVEDIQLAGGTILGASRIDPFNEPDGPELVKKNMERHGCDLLLPIGGDQTLKIASRIAKLGIKLVGIPKTLDNNLSLTDYTFGFTTACNIASEAIERLRTSARSRDGLIVVEVLGAQSGWIALYSGVAGGAHMALIPEAPFAMREIYDMIKRRRKIGKEYAVIVVAEGARPKSAPQLKDYEKHRAALESLLEGSGIASWLVKQIQDKTGREAQSVTLGNIQRGGAPTAFDRVLGMRLGVQAVDLAHAGKFGLMAALHGTKLTGVLLDEAVKTIKTVPPELYAEMSMFFA